MITKKDIKELEIKQAIINLKKEYIKPTSKIYVVQKAISQSGMMRTLQLYVLKQGYMYNITNLVGKALDWRYTKDGLKVGGCGMDMHFHTIYCLTDVLYGFDNNIKSFKGNGGNTLDWQSL